MGYPGDLLGRNAPDLGRHGRAAPSDAGAAAARPSWVPIRSLAPRHRRRIEAHLLALSPSDRYLRFGFPSTDAQIAGYVRKIDFETDEVFGIFNRRLELIAMAHLACEPAAEQVPGRPKMAEFGVSVLRKARGRGYGARLFDHAAMHARNRGFETLYIQALSENAAMLHIARNAGATVERDGGESHAWLKLPPETLATQVEELVGTHAAEMDYQLKRQAVRLGQLIEGVQDIRQQIGRGIGSQ